MSTASLGNSGSVAEQPVRIALLQMTSGIDPAANADTLRNAAAEAARGGAAMLFAPEMAGLLDRDRVRASPHVVDEGRNLWAQTAMECARDHGLWIHAGSVPVPGPDGRWRNRNLIFAPDGSVAARYDKQHLFDVDLPTGESWRESSAYAAGERTVLSASPFGPLGLTICYDLRFPALFAALSGAGAVAIAVPSAFTVPTGAAHWHLLLRARAVENACYIIAPAQTGQHEDGRTTYGHSLVVDPWGDVLLDMGDAPGVGFAEVDPARVAEVRGRVPVIEHRRTIPDPG
ncbi:MAG: carbon-nitrogen hydrolase family protein [Sphingopyxis sp.]|nr:carbon-nitrogen hydrolase family protein [Sphingopyxis sp.]